MTTAIYLTGPSGLQAKTAGTTEIEVSWIPSHTPGTIAYTVSLVPVTGGPTVTAITGESTITVNGLMPGTSYQIQVMAALQGTNRTARSGKITSKTNAAKVTLAGPSGLKARTLSSSSFQLTWNPSSTPGAVYTVLVWQLQSGVYNLLNLPNATTSATSFTVTGLSAGGLFRAQIRATLPGTNQTAMSGTVSGVATQRASTSTSSLPSASQDVGGGGYASGNGEGDNSSYQAPSFNGGIPLDEDEN